MRRRFFAPNKRPSPPPMIIKPEDYDYLRQAGKINGRVLATLKEALQPNITTLELDHIARDILKEEGAEAPFLGYTSTGEHPYPATINVSVNEQLVHGIPNGRKIRSGDVVTLDCGTNYKGLIADSAITLGVGEIPEKYAQLIEATEKALAMAIDLAKPGCYIGDLSFGIESVLRQYKINIPLHFGGHGVGYALHAPPHVANWGKPHHGQQLEVGMALAIEPMGMYGSSVTALLDDHWTVVAVDGSICAHTEHSILITETGAEVLTALPETVG